MSAEPRRAAVHLRISQDRENRRLGVDRHREDAEALIKARGWTPAGVYEDNDISGTGTKRPAFERQLAEIERGLIDVVVAQEWPRLERNRADGVHVIETAQRHEILLTFVKGSDIDCTTAAGASAQTSSQRSHAARSRSKAKDKVVPNGNVQSRGARRKAYAHLATPSRVRSSPMRRRQSRPSIKHSLPEPPYERSKRRSPARPAPTSPACHHSPATPEPSL